MLCDGECVVECRSRLEGAHARSDRIRFMSNPANGAQASAMIFIHDRSPDGFANLEHLLRLGAAHFDTLLVDRERLPSVRGSVACGILGIDLELYEIAPIAVAVRESPSNVRIAACHHERCSRKRDADNTMAVPAQHRTEPDIRYGMREVHIARQKTAAAGRACPGEDPVVAPDIAAPKLPALSAPTAHVPNSCGRRGARGIRRRDGWRRDGISDDGRIPIRPEGREKLRELRWEDVVDQALSRFVTVPGVV